MPLLLTTALLASTATLPACSWDRPGVNPFMGNVVASVDRYADIPSDVRARLKQRMTARRYDEVATISRDAITGKARYSPELREMHFGQGTVCRSVSRSGWSAKMVERGLVYCEGEHCLIVPTVCRNLSRVTRLPNEKVSADDTLEGPGLMKNGSAIDAIKVAQASGMEVPDGAGELLFDAPGAGLPAGLPSGSFADNSGGLIGPNAPAGAGSNVPGAIDVGGGSSPDGVVPDNNAPTPLGDVPVAWPPAPLPIGGGAAPVGILPPVVIDGSLPIPEPQTWALWTAGLVAVLAVARRRRVRQD